MRERKRRVAAGVGLLVVALVGCEVKEVKKEGGLAPPKPTAPSVAEVPKEPEAPKLPYTVEEIQQAFDVVVIPATVPETESRLGEGQPPKELLDQIEQEKARLRKQLEDYLADKPDEWRTGRLPITTTHTKSLYRSALEAFLAGKDKDQFGRPKRDWGGKPVETWTMRADLNTSAFKVLARKVAAAKKVAENNAEKLAEARPKYLDALRQCYEQLRKNVAQAAAEKSRSDPREAARWEEPVLVGMGRMTRLSEVRGLELRRPAPGFPDSPNPMSGKDFDRKVLEGFEEPTEKMLKVYEMLQANVDVVLAAKREREKREAAAAREAWERSPEGQAHRKAIDKAYAKGKALRSKYLDRNNAMLRLLEQNAGNDGLKHAEAAGYMYDEEVIRAYVNGVVGN